MYYSYFNITHNIIIFKSHKYKIKMYYSYFNITHHIRIFKSHKSILFLKKTYITRSLSQT
jgi:hypothetical protein